jgi:hypothetical protein
MLDFVAELKSRNIVLFHFGWVCLFFALGCLVFSLFSDTQVYGINAWFKPFKFAFSTFLYAWAMAWYCSYLPKSFSLPFFNWSIVILLGLEVAYIAFQAARGQLSHYNISTWLYANLYSAMAVAATLVTLYTAYVAYLFFKYDFLDLPNAYLWAIRFGLILFVIFAFEGFVMGSRLSHTIGGLDGGKGLPILNWSTQYGDPRIPHFIGMHALQILPLVSFYVLKSTKWCFFLSACYLGLAIFTLILALKGKPLLRTDYFDDKEEIVNSN